MADTSSVPSILFGAGGIVVPAETDVLAGVLADTNAAFGGDMNVTNLETPQGQLASSLTAIVADKDSQIAYVVNQVDPAFAEGRFQDAIGRIYLLERNGAEPTVLQVTALGAAGVVIPAAWPLATDPSGNVYVTTASTTIPVGGSIAVAVENQINGAIPVPVSVSGYKAIPGLDSVTLVSGVLGQETESRAEFEFRRQQSVAINATGSLPAIYANVFAVDGVLDVYVAENTKSTNITVGATNYTLVPHSIYVAAVGGVAADIALAIWLRKNTGADYNGNTTVTVVDNSGYNVPYPSYQVSFNIPAATPILFAVQVANNSNLPSNIVALVQAAIISAFAGGDGGSRARTGSTIFASRYYGPVSAVSTFASVLSIKIGIATANQDSITLGIDQSPTVTSSNISVTLV